MEGLLEGGGLIEEIYYAYAYVSSENMASVSITQLSPNENHVTNHLLKKKQTQKSAVSTF